MANLIAFIIRRFGVTPNVARYAAYAVLGLVIMALAALAFSVPGCMRGRQRAAQARLDAAQTQAATNSASDAIATQGAVNGRTNASEDLTRTNAEDIRNAQGANDAVNPAVRDAGRASVCKRPSYKNSTFCTKR